MRKIIFIIFAVIFLSCKKEKEPTPIIYQANKCEYFFTLKESDKQDIHNYTCNSRNISIKYVRKNIDHIAFVVSYDKNDTRNFIEIDTRDTRRREVYFPETGDWVYVFDGIEYLNKGDGISHIFLKEHEKMKFAEGRYYFEGFNGSKMITIKGEFYIDLSNEN